jgi:hypothetical protein
MNKKKSPQWEIDEKNREEYLYQTFLIKPLALLVICWPVISAILLIATFILVVLIYQRLH